MAPESGFFKAGFPAFLLRSAVLGIALIMQASAARAETLNLLCEWDKGGSSTFLIDFDQKTVQAGSSTSCTWTIGGNERVVPDCNPPGRADITENYITWKTTGKQMDGAGGIHNSLVKGSIDRQAGSVNYSENSDFGSSSMFGKCRRATKKF